MTTLSSVASHVEEWTEDARADVDDAAIHRQANRAPIPHDDQTTSYTYEAQLHSMRMIMPARVHVHSSASAEFEIAFKFFRKIRKFAKYLNIVE